VANWSGPKCTAFLFLASIGDWIHATGSSARLTYDQENPGRLHEGQLRASQPMGLARLLIYTSASTRFSVDFPGTDLRLPSIC